MTRKFALAAFAATLALSPMLTSGAEARDGRRTAAAIGIAAGIGGILLGSAIANAQPRYQAEPRYQAQPRHFGHAVHGVVYEDESECFRKPVRRIDRFTGEVITVGSRVVCR